MTSTQKSILTAERDRLLARVRDRHLLTIERFAESMDQIQADILRRQAEREKTSDSERLALIDEALCRIESGEYGICRDCEEKIPAKRLAAVPFANKCIRCQSRDEQRREIDHCSRIVEQYVS